MSQEKTLEERVYDLEQNIYALNQSTTETATAMKELLTASQAKASHLATTLDAALGRVCPFPPECGGFGND